ncbi:MAG TPA: phosphotransferase family protein [Sphingomonas sp.]|nr:phosphotransferase family protein [Sphingomonas sp.]
MSYSHYLGSVTSALRDRVLPRLDDQEARGVLEAAIRTLAGLADTFETDRLVPPLLDLPSAATRLDGPPENGAVRIGSAATIAAAVERLRDDDWLQGGSVSAEARTMIVWERDRMSEAFAAMTRVERPVESDSLDTGPNPLLIPREEVETYFQGKYGGAARVGDFRQATGGRSRQTVLFTLEGQNDLPRDLVIQRDHPAGISPDSVVDSYPVLALLAGTELMSPRPLLVEPSQEPLGAPFMVTTQSRGEIAGPDYFDPPRDPALGMQLAGQLGILHAVDTTPLRGTLRSTIAPDDSWAAELDRLEATWNRFTHWPSIAATASFAWMRAHVDEIGDEAAIIHNDAVFHNILVDEGRITALLDWELVHLGHPAEDLGYCRPFIMRMGDWEEFLDAYVAAGGRRFSRNTIDYFSLRSQLHLMTLFQNGGRRMFEARATDDINLAEVGASFMPKVMLRLSEILSAVIAG